MTIYGYSVQGIFIVLIGSAIVSFIYHIAVYNGLINKQNSARRAFSGIDIQLKKRWDLIPQLVETVKGYASHEKEVVTKITEARNTAMHASNNTHLRMSSEQTISQETAKIMALAESYPEIKADEQFLWLQRNLTEIESQISASRRAFNASVLKYNNSLQTFPTNLIAGKHGFSEMHFFTIEPSERNNVRI